MKKRAGNWIVPLFCAGITTGAGIALVLHWQIQNFSADIVPGLPGQDNQPENRGNISRISKREQAGIFSPGQGVAGGPDGTWSRFRGNDSRNSIVTPAYPPATNWDASPPEILWMVELGEGHAAPVVHDGRVFVLDYAEDRQADTLRCLSLADGKEIWSRSYPVPMKRNHGLSRTIPAVTDAFVLTLGPRCHVMCVETDTGNYLWGKDLQAEFGTKEPFWYAGQCPLIENGIAVIAPAGPEVLMMGVDCASGEILWQTPNPGEWKMSHSSVMPMVVDGVKMYVYCAVGGIAGIAAEGEDRGNVLWQVSGWTPSVIAPSPVISDDGYVFVTAGYGSGSALIKVDRQDSSFKAEILTQFGPKEGLACEQQTPILKDGLLYGILPKDAGGMRNQFVCTTLENPQKILAASGKQARFGLGPFLNVGDIFLILNDDGTLVMSRLSPAGYEELGRKSILQGRDAWGPLALVGNHLLLRDDRTLACLRLP